MSKRHPGVRTRTLVRKVDGMLFGVGDGSQTREQESRQWKGGARVFLSEWG